MPEHNEVLLAEEIVRKLAPKPDQAIKYDQTLDIDFDINAAYEEIKDNPERKDEINFINTINEIFNYINDWTKGLEIEVKLDNREALRLGKQKFLFKITDLEFNVREIVGKILRKKRVFDKLLEKNWKLPIHQNQLFTSLIHLIQIISRTSQGNMAKTYFNGDPFIGSIKDYNDFYGTSEHHGTAFNSKNDNSIKKYRSASWNRVLPHTLCIGSTQCGKSGVYLFQIINNYIYNFMLMDHILKGDQSPIHPYPDLPSKKEVSDNFQDDWNYFIETFGSLAVSFTLHFAQLKDDKNYEVTRQKRSSEIIHIIDYWDRQYSITTDWLKKITDSDRLAAEIYTANKPRISYTDSEKFAQIFLENTGVSNLTTPQLKKLKKMLDNSKSILDLLEKRIFTKSEIIKKVWRNLALKTNYTINQHWDEAHWGVGDETLRKMLVDDVKMSDRGSKHFLTMITATPGMYIGNENIYYTFFRYPDGIPYVGLPYFIENMHHDPSCVIEPDFYYFGDLPKEYYTIDPTLANLKRLNVNILPTSKQRFYDRTLDNHCAISNPGLDTTTKDRLIKLPISNMKLNKNYLIIANQSGLIRSPIYSHRSKAYYKTPFDISDYRHKIHADYQRDMRSSISKLPFVWLKTIHTSKNYANSKDIPFCGIIRYDQADVQLIVNLLKIEAAQYNKAPLDGIPVDIKEYYSDHTSPESFIKAVNEWKETDPSLINKHIIVVAQSAFTMAVRIPSYFKFGFETTDFNSSLESDSMLQGLFGRFSGYNKEKPTLISSFNSYIFFESFKIRKGDIFLPGKHRIYKQDLSDYKQVDFWDFRQFLIDHHPSLLNDFLQWAQDIVSDTFKSHPGVQDNTQKSNQKYSIFWNKIFDSSVTGFDILKDIENRFNFDRFILRPNEPVDKLSPFNYILNRVKIVHVKGKTKPQRFYEQYIPGSAASGYDRVFVGSRNSWENDIITHKRTESRGAGFRRMQFGANYLWVNFLDPSVTDISNPNFNPKSLTISGSQNLPGAIRYREAINKLTEIDPTGSNNVPGFAFPALLAFPLNKRKHKSLGVTPTGGVPGAIMPT